jgi:sarcosine oxidase
MERFDCIVLGVGGMGSSACYHLSERKQKVLGLEQFGIAHDRGSSHGETRLIRKAYFEHPNYVPLLQRSYELWDELGVKAQTPLLHRTGLVIFGPGNGKILKGIRKSAKEHSLSITEFPDEAAKTFPPLQAPTGFDAIYEKEGGFLEVEKCVETHITQARKTGADLRFQEKVESWKSEKDGVVVHTQRGKYWAKRLIVTAGAWTRQIFSDLGMSLKVCRAPLYWFSSSVKIDVCFAFDLPYGFIYGFPTINGLIKIAHHKPGDEVPDPTCVDRNLNEADALPVVQAIGECLPGVDPTPRRSAVCLYTMTQDENFIIDQYPGDPRVIFAAGFSGHGFKFSSVIGEILCDLALTGVTRHPIDFLRLR